MPLRKRANSPYAKSVDSGIYSGSSRSQSQTRVLPSHGHRPDLQRYPPDYDFDDQASGYLHDGDSAYGGSNGIGHKQGPYVPPQNLAEMLKLGQQSVKNGSQASKSRISSTNLSKGAGRNVFNTVTGSLHRLISNLLHRTHNGRKDYDNRTALHMDKARRLGMTWQAYWRKYKIEPRLAPGPYDISSTASVQSDGYRRPHHAPREADYDELSEGCSESQSYDSMSLYSTSTGLPALGGRSGQAYCPRHGQLHRPFYGRERSRSRQAFRRGQSAPPDLRRAYAATGYTADNEDWFSRRTRERSSATPDPRVEESKRYARTKRENGISYAERWAKQVSQDAFSEAPTMATPHGRPRTRPAR